MVKVAAVLEFSQETQHHNRITTRKDVQRRLNVNLLPKTGHMSGQVLVAALVAD